MVGCVVGDGEDVNLCVEREIGEEFGIDINNINYIIFWIIFIFFISFLWNYINKQNYTKISWIYI